MNTEDLIKLMEGVSRYKLTSFRLKEGNQEITIEKKDEITLSSGTITRQPAKEPDTGENPDEGAGRETQDDDDEIIRSPLVGTFYAAPNPESESFVKIGDHVAKGQTLAVIEAMKLMNELEAEYDGVIEEIFVKNEALVEYGQPLFRARREG